MDAETVKEDSQKEGTESASQQEAVPAAPSKPLEPAKRQRRDDRNRKDDRNYELFMKAVQAAPPTEQLQIASQKYITMLEENKKMQFYIKQSDKRHAIIMKEKEQLQLEFNKTVLLKSKLENLCRELQKQNKCIKEESLHKIREEEERRKETQAKFQSTLTEISALLQQNNEKNAKLRDDNISMTEKFKTVVQQYQIREDQVEKMSKQMELESQLNAAKMQKASLEHQAERERLTVEMETLRMAVAEYRSKVNEMQGTETVLRSQLAVYTDKYDEFQSALMKSNQVFGGFKDQMDRMSKRIKLLEKESLSWKQRWEGSQSALLEMCSERQAADARLGAVQRQLAHMQSLCRTLQSERTLLLGTLKEHDIERPPLGAPPAPAPEPLPAPPVHSAASDAKVDAMAVNCAQLRQSLAHLQSQLNVLTTQQAEEPAQPEKPKKNRNKKKGKKPAVDESKATTEEVADDKPVEISEVDAEEESKEATETTTDDKTVEVTTEIETEEKKTVTEGTNNEESTDTKESASEVETVPTEFESVDLEVEKVDEKVLESLMEAINISNVNLCNLEVDNSSVTIEEVLDAKIEEITDSENKELKVTVSKENDAKENGVVETQELISPKKEILDVPVTPKKAESPKSSPKKIASPKSSPKKNASKDSPKKAGAKIEVHETILKPANSNSEIEIKDSNSESHIDVEIKEAQVKV